MVICGWGNHGKLQGRGENVVYLAQNTRCDLHALKITNRGQPVHPLYQPYSTKPFLWKVAA